MDLRQEQAKLLIECLPYMRRFRGETVVIKYGGHAMVDEELKRSFALSITLLKHVGMNPVIVHGGGPQINQMLDSLQIKSTFRDGMRVTDNATMDVVEMVLVGKVNREIVNLLNSAGIKAVGISGKDSHFLKAYKMEMVIEGSGAPEIIDLGKVGEVASVDTNIIETLCNNDFVPVIAPIGVDENGDTYNINADSVAGAIAASLRAKRLILLTDVAGILNIDRELIRSIDIDEVWDLFSNATITGGMIPKVKCCIEAMQAGVEKAMIIDGRVEHCVLLELFTDTGIGTEIVRKSRKNNLETPVVKDEIII